MAPMEAMRLYVRTLDEERKSWYQELLQSIVAGSTDEATAAAPAAAASNGNSAGDGSAGDLAARRDGAAGGAGEPEARSPAGAGGRDGGAGAGGPQPAAGLGGQQEQLPPLQTADSLGSSKVADLASFATTEGADSQRWTVVTMRASSAAASGKLPLPRYEHGSALLGHHVYIVGGNYGERLRWRCC
jgi:hypothetical protein